MTRFVLFLFVLALSQITYSKGREPIKLVDKVLVQAEIINGVPFEAGVHVEVWDTKYTGSEDDREIIARRAGSVIKLGPITYSGDYDLKISFGTPYIATAASNIGDQSTHHSVVEIKNPGYNFSGVLEKNTLLSGVEFGAKDFLYEMRSAPAPILLFCNDSARTQACFAPRSENIYQPIGGVAVRETELDGVPVLVGDYLMFQGDGHPASIIGWAKYDNIFNRWDGRPRKLTLSLMHNGALENHTIYAQDVTFNKFHHPSVVNPGRMQRLYGIPLGEPGSLTREAIMIYPDGSYKIGMAPDKVFVYENLPLSRSGSSYGPDISFNSQGFLTGATLGGPIIYGKVLLREKVDLVIDHGKIKEAHLGGGYLQYAFEGTYRGEDIFVIAPKMVFSDAGDLIDIIGQPTNEEFLKKTYRESNRVIRMVP